MTVRKLTADFAKRAVVEDGAERSVYWDEKQPGFGLMVTERGHRSWVVQYRAHHHTRRLTLDFVLSLDAARKEAKKVLGEVARGGDPVVERRKAADAERHALRAIVDEYFAREGKKLRSADKRRGTLEKHVLPKLGTWSIYDIKRTDIQRARSGGRPFLNFVAVLLGGIPDRYLGDPRRHAENLPDLFGR